MTIPLNHHYVSQCLMKNFFNEKKEIFCYDKELDLYKKYNSSKRIFSEEGLNSILDDDSQINHTEIEERLNKHFEKDFPIHYKKIVDLVNMIDKIEVPSLELTDDILNSIRYIMKMGIIGEMRTPDYKSEMDNSIISVYKMLSQNAVQEIKDAFTNFEIRHSVLKYKSPIDFNELSEKVMNTLGEFIITISIAPKNSFFLLPDSSSFAYRFKLFEDDVVDGVTYINPRKDIGLIGMPLNGKIFLKILASKISKNKMHKIKYLNAKEVMDHNRHLLLAAKKRVLCENEKFLRAAIQILFKK